MSPGSMAKTLQVSYSQVRFPNVCSVCLSTSAGTYKLERNFAFGRRTVPVELQVPMCPVHLTEAKSRTRGERAAKTAGLTAGILVGVGTVMGLLSYWASIHVGNLVFNLLLAGILGVGIFLIFWIATVMWISPHYASPEAKTARESVQMTAFWPQEDQVELRFENERMAQLVAAENIPQSAAIETKAEEYQIEAHLLCPELRLSTWIRTTVRMGHRPSDQEAEQLLWPAAETLTAEKGGAGKPYELTHIEIHPV